MNDELIECYNLLGLNPGASLEELKEAHRDLAKVWHPDRFVHDPHLQEKAQEKLKKINEAYDQLRLGKAKRQTQTSAYHAQTAGAGIAQRVRWQLILAPLLIFAVAFLLAFRSLVRTGELENHSQIPAIEQVQNQTISEQQPASRINASANDLEPGKALTEESDAASTSQPTATTFRPLPTVTIMIDPTTGMIATPNCPMKSRMTYPSGSEPREHCASHPAAPAAPAGAPNPKESRLKSVAKRIASPGKWFGSEAKSVGASKPDSKSP